MLILKSGTQHWEDHISVKYWSILRIYDIFEIRILWASQKRPKVLSNVLCRPRNCKKQSVQSISGQPVHDMSGCLALLCPMKYTLQDQPRFISIFLWNIPGMTQNMLLPESGDKKIVYQALTSYSSSQLFIWSRSQ